MSNDFKVVQYDYTGYLPSGMAVARTGHRWAVMLARNVLVAVKHTKEEADALAENLNRDPWFLDRGYTKTDRAAGF